MSGDDRRSRRRRSRSHSRDRRRSRSYSRSRGRRSRSRSRGRYRPRSRTRSGSRERHRHRHRHYSRSRSADRRRRSASAGRRGQDVQDRYQATFTSGGRAFEDNGGLPALAGETPRGGSGRLSQYAAALSAGLDASLDQQPYGDGAGHAPRRPPPSNVLCIRGLPDDAEEADLYKLFEPVPGVVAVRVVRDRHTQLCRGFAYLELSTPEAAGALMDSDWRDQTYYGEHRLRFSFDVAGRPEGGGGGPGERPADWVCEQCQAVNFSRRFECYQCSSARTATAQRVSIEPDAPSYILRAAGLEPQTSEETLYYLFAPVAPVKEIRMVRDKYTAAPRGFAFVHFYTVPDAAKALHALQNSPVEGQQSTLKLSFAKDRFGQLAHTAGANGLAEGQQDLLAQGDAYTMWEPKGYVDGAAAGEAAAGGGGAGDPYAGWEPKAFADAEEGGQEAAEAAAGPELLQQQQQQQAGEATGGATQQQQRQELGQQQAGYAAYDPSGAAAYGVGAQHPEQYQQQQQAVAAPGYGAAVVGAAPAAVGAGAYSLEHAAAGYDPFAAGAEAAGAGAGPSGQHAGQQGQQGQQQAGFEYDQETGYMKDPVSGYLYDANTGLYFHPTLRQWGTYDHASQQFVPYEDHAQAAAGAHAVHAAAQPGVSTAAESAVAMTNVALYASKAAPPQQPQHAQRAAAQQAQRAASAAAYSALGQQAPEQQQQQRPAARRKGAVIGAAPKLDAQGLLEAARAAEEKAQLLEKLQEQKAARAAAAQQRKAAAAQQQQQKGATACAVPAPAASGGVQGVIHRGKWSRKV